MKVRILKNVKIKDFFFEYGKEYEVEDKLGDWMVSYNIADKQIGLALPQKKKVLNEEIVDRLSKIIVELQNLRDDLL